MFYLSAKELSNTYTIMITYSSDK